MTVGVQIPAYDNPGGACVRLVLMHDAEGKVLVLVPSDKLLNMAAVWSLSGRKLRAVRGEDTQRYFSQGGLQSEEGQQRLMHSFTLLVDASLQGQSEINLCELRSGLSFQWRVNTTPEQKVLYGELAQEPETIPLQSGAEAGRDAVVITRAVERFTALRIQQRLEDTLGLPALAPTTQKIIMLRSDPDSGVDALVPVVRLDPSLSAQVMSWAASPYYAAPGKVESIEDAVIRVLGFDLVVNLALGIAMGQVLNLPEDVPRGSTPYWKQSVYTATLCELLTRRMPIETRPKTGLAYLSGLLNNFGYLVLAHLFQPQFSILSRYIEANPHLEPQLVEQHVLKVTRDQVGGWLMDSWNLPSEVCSGIRQQQFELPIGDGEPYARLLRLAQALLRREQLADGPITTLEPDMYEPLGLSDGDLEDAVAALLANRDSLDQLTHTLSRHRTAV
ncbi:aminoacyl-tRNA deacylase and HDOD domain-containing protein [Marinobacterium mangrovicola]|uniref:HD-like signal output (HDOD) protein n=1 Tax=Marinobacterium mangrovicola TaxID=1476959 RepID=A0A4R1GGP4_9GAMM|nr:HDOD domain-containing protein [Marinobacterium mangrovicola]TCK06100.1 HD-like signal output (HDOD) protein [Marinobacterium mangrovicola]